jgi:hypothetical protein
MLRLWSCALGHSAVYPQIVVLWVRTARCILRLWSSGLGHSAVYAQIVVFRVRTQRGVSSDCGLPG